MEIIMNKLIYIADDDDNIRNLLKTFLEREGFHVTGFPTGDKLFEVFSNSPADLIILDVMMPGHDGFFILKEIRKTSNVPIIMLTAKDSDTDYIQGLDMGSDDYFTKPFSPIKLVSKVKSILKRQEEITGKTGDKPDNDEEQQAPGKSSLRDGDRLVSVAGQPLYDNRVHRPGECSHQA